MNKTIAINIAGLIFNIEEEAFQILHSYLESIRINFSDANERDEIMGDIEARIAELFQLEISDRKEVITLKDVDKVISIMGQPEDYQTDEDTDQQYEHREEYTKFKKRLFRDRENATIGGVCSGLGAYFGLDPVIFKIGFVITALLGGSGGFIYIIMLFVIPEAKTTAEKLQMRGEKVNIDNIKKHIHDLKDDLTSKETKGRIKNKVRNTVDRGINASSGAIKIFGQVFGFAITVGGIFGLFIIISLLIGETGLFPLWGERSTENLSDLMDLLYQTSFQSTVTYFSILAILFIPMIGMITTGIKLIFRLKLNFKAIGISMSILWFVAIGIVTLTSIQLSMEFREKSQVIKDIQLNTINGDVLNIDIMNDEIFSNHINFKSPFRYSQLVKISGEKFHIGSPTLEIIENEGDSTFQIEVIKSSRGLSQQEAIYKAESIEYNLITEGNNVLLSSILTLNRDDKLRSQQVTVLVKVPEGKSVHFGGNIQRMPPATCKDCYHDNQFINSTWTMKNKKLEAAIID